MVQVKTEPRAIDLNDHVITNTLEVKPGESLAEYADRLISQAFYPRSGMSDAEMERLGKAHDYIKIYSERFALDIIRMSVDELRETQIEIAKMFDVNPRSRELASRKT